MDELSTCLKSINIKFFIFLLFCIQDLHRNDTKRPTLYFPLLTGVLKVSKASVGEKRVLRRERELIEALRAAQREEARALEHQRELLEKLRAVNAREAAAEREQIESLRTAQLEEAKDLSRQREEVEKEKSELLKMLEELQRQ